MKWAIITESIIIVLLSAALALVIIHYKNEKPTNIDIVREETHNPEIKPVPNPYACGPSIYYDDPLWLNENTFRIVGWNDCMSVHQDFKLKFSCPKTKYTFGLSFLGGIANIPNIADKSGRAIIDGIIGGEFDMIRHFGIAGMGAGGWYIKGLKTDFWAAGAKTTINISFGKQ